MKAILTGAYILVVARLLISESAAALLTFDDIYTLPSGDVNVMPGGYGCLYWTNFNYLDAVNSPLNPSGYQNGLISRSNVTFNAYGNPAQIGSTVPFDLDSGFFTAAWSDGLQLEVQGFLAGKPLYDNIYTLNTSGPIFIRFGYVGIDSANFISYGGTNHYRTTGEQFAIDNLSVTVADIGPRIKSIVAAPNVLWPPDRRMVPVTLIVDAVDNCDPSPVIRITEIKTNEPRNPRVPEWEIIGPLAVNLRAERLGTGVGRIYTIVIQCEDVNGKVSFGSVDITVPHGQD